MSKKLTPWIAASLLFAAVATAAPLADGDLPFEMPAMAKTDAKAGEPVFVLNMKLIRNAWDAGKRDGFPTQFLLATMKTPGAQTSVVHFVDDETVPNVGIIRIPKLGKLKKGDIVAGKWAVNMTRGVVVDPNPKAPKVRFIGLAADNPAKADDKTTGIGMYDYTLAPGELMVISKPYDPASACALKQGSDYKVMQVFRASGDRVMGIVHTDLVSAKKADCIPLPIKPTYKVGQVVWASWVSTMAKGTITKVDVGRYQVKFEKTFMGEPLVSFGEVIDKLP